MHNNVSTQKIGIRADKRSKIQDPGAWGSPTLWHEGVPPLQTGVSQGLEGYLCSFYGYKLSFYGHSELIISTNVGLLAGTARNWMKAPPPLIVEYH